MVNIHSHIKTCLNDHFNDYTKHTTPILTLPTAILTEPHIFNNNNTNNNNNNINNTETIIKLPPPTTTTTLPILHLPITSPLKQPQNVNNNNNKRDYDTMSEESYNHLHTPSSTSTESPNDLISSWEMNDTVAQLIIEVLGAMLKKVKIDIWNALLQQQHKYVDDIPDVPLMAIKTFLYQVQQVDDNSNTKPFNHQTTAEMYCLMTGFMSIYLGLIEILFNDLVQQDMNNIYQNEIKPFDQFIGFFSCKDDVISSSDDYFTWYHWQHRNELVNDLQYRFYTKGIQSFRSLTLIDTVITQFYTTHLLQPVAQQHQKDHGQFYTPQSVVQFMWNRCLNNTNNISNNNNNNNSNNNIHHEQLQKSSSFLFINNNNDNNNDNDNDNTNNEIKLPRVFDPCMGIGSFLCEYLTRLIEEIKRYHQEEIWNNGHVLKNILSQLSETIWGVEIDPFAFKLGKLNIMIHMFPFYQRCLFLLSSSSTSSTATTTIPLLNDHHQHHPNLFFKDFKIGRLSLFRNDTLRLDINHPPHESSSSSSISLWEKQQLEKLRDPSQLTFDYIVTNPPYMIRKTGFINDPDTTLYDDTYLGGKGTQAYMYFMWFCLQRCDPITGQLCFITPSQWTVLQFAESLRSWIWKNCQLLEFFQFEPYKVWPKVQTDSLIFRIRKRPYSNMIENKNDDHQVLFLRYLSRKSSLTEILNAYEQFDSTNIHLLTITTTTTTSSSSSFQEEEDPFIKYKLTPTNNLQLFDTVMHKSFGYLSPTSIVSDQLMEITRHHPRLCDGERGKKGSISPLIWHRGPNTNPVYGLVVRTQWAMDQFGKDYCDQWLKPVFYWNGKSSMSRSSSSLYISPSSSSSTSISTISSSSSTSLLSTTLTSNLLPINTSFTTTNTTTNTIHSNNNNNSIINNNLINNNNNNNYITSTNLKQHINNNINGINDNKYITHIASINSDNNNNIHLNNINISNINNNNNRNSNYLNINSNNNNINHNNKNNNSDKNDSNINNISFINTFNNYNNNIISIDTPPPPSQQYLYQHHQQQQQQLQNHSNEFIHDKRCKEIRFWYHRDPQRLTKKETSPAEAYIPFDRLDEKNQPFYSIILINKEDSEKLDPSSSLYQYLKETRQELQPGQMDKKIAWCHYNKCGMDQPVKFVHPINFGYFSRTQPRQRFFMDRSFRCVTNQCMYFTIKASQPIIQSSSMEEIKKEKDDVIIKKEKDHQEQQNEEINRNPLTNTHIEYYFLGLLNSSTVQFFIRAHCYYDQQGRTRFFGKHMASIPYAIPTTHQMIQMDDYVQQLVIIRHLIYYIIRYVDDQIDHSHYQQQHQQQQCKTSSSIKTIMEKVRNCTWDLSFIDYNLLSSISPHFLSAMVLPNTLENNNNKEKWITIKTALEQGGGDLANQMTRLLIVQSLLQYSVDHLTFDIYHIPYDLQIGLEQELGLSLTLQWQMYQDHFQKYTTLSKMVACILNGTLLID
ncbi:unnamed protein product [Cunninghamella blakesleeana]